MVQWVKNPTSIYEDVGPIPGLTQWIKVSSVAANYGVGHGCGADLGGAGGCSSDPPLGRGTSIGGGGNPKKKKKKKKKQLGGCLLSGADGTKYRGVIHCTVKMVFH